MANHFGCVIPDPEGDAVYENGEVSVRKTQGGWFIVYKGSVITHYRHDKTDALRLACDMSADTWMKEYQS
jgi:hypothetical protein